MTGGDGSERWRRQHGPRQRLAETECLLMISVVSCDGYQSLNEACVWLVMSLKEKEHHCETRFLMSGPPTGPLVSSDVLDPRGGNSFGVRRRSFDTRE